MNIQEQRTRGRQNSKQRRQAAHDARSRYESPRDVMKRISQDLVRHIEGLFKEKGRIGAGMKVRVHCAMSLQGCERNDVLDLADDLTEAQIEEEVREWALEQFEWTYEIAKP